MYIYIDNQHQQSYISCVNLETIDTPIFTSPRSRAREAELQAGPVSRKFQSDNDGGTNDACQPWMNYTIVS